MRHLCAMALIGLSGSAMGQIDGSITEAGYQLIWSHSEGTGFGNNRSEINGIWAYCDNTTLYLGVTGNVQDFNKLDLFFDTGAGGQNSLRMDNADVDFDQLNTNMGGLTFDAGFEANYYLTYTVSGNRDEHFTAAAQLNTGGGGPGGFQGGGAYVDGDQIVAAGANGFGYTLGTNQSNTGGVADFCNAPDSDPPSGSNSSAAQGVRGAWSAMRSSGSRRIMKHPIAATRCSTSWMGRMSSCSNPVLPPSGAPTRRRRNSSMTARSNPLSSWASRTLDLAEPTNTCPPN